MADQKSLCIEVISDDSPCISQVSGEDGCSAQQVNIEGKVVNIMVKKDGQSMFGLRIMSDGSVVFTSYHSYFSCDVARQLRLTNDRPWE